MKRARSADDFFFLLNRRIWRNYFKPLIYGHLSPLSRASVLEAVFPALKEIIYEEWIIGERVFACSELSVAQVMHYKLEKHDFYKYFAAMSDRPELFDLVSSSASLYTLELLESRNLYRYIVEPFVFDESTIRAILKHDDPERFHLLDFNLFNTSLIHRVAVQMGAWKTAAAFSENANTAPAVSYLRGAMISKNFAMIDKYVDVIPDIYFNSMVVDFEVLKYIENRRSISLTRFLCAAKTDEDANHILELLDRHYFPSRICLFDNAMSLTVVKRLYHHVTLLECAPTNVDMAAFLLQIGCLHITKTFSDAVNDGNLEMLHFLKYRIVFDKEKWTLLMRIAVNRRRMQLMRFARFMGAIPNWDIIKACIITKNRYMCRWLLNKIRSKKCIYRTLAELHRNGWHEEEQQLLKKIIKK